MNDMVCNMMPQQPSIPKDKTFSGKQSSSEKADDFRRLLGDKSETQADERPELPERETISKNQEETPTADLEETVKPEVLLNGIQIPVELFGLQNFVADDQGNTIPVSQESMTRGVFAVEETAAQIPVEGGNTAQATQVIADQPFVDAGENADMQQQVSTGEREMAQVLNAQKQASRHEEAAQGLEKQKAAQVGEKAADQKAALREQGNISAATANGAEGNSGQITAEPRQPRQSDEKRDMNSEDSQKSAGKEDGLTHMRTFSAENTSQVHAPKTVETFGSAQESDLMKQVSEYLDKSALRGAKELELQLNPKELGKLSIKIASQDGRTEVTILCSSSKTLKTLSENAGEIGRIMESNLGTPTSIVTEFKEDGSQGYSEQRQESDAGQSFSDGSDGQSGNRSHSEEQRRDRGSFIQQLRLGLV